MRPLTHAGGVVYRRIGGTATVLLVRASRPPHHWVLPKGHIEWGEEPRETAHREVVEEAGVDAAVERHLEDLSYDVPSGERVRVAYFLMRFVRTATPTESREVCWCTFDEARRRVEFDNARDVIDAARRAVAPPDAPA